MSNTAAEPKGEIVLLPPITALQLFETGGVRSILDKIKAEAKSRVTDATTESGRKEIKSLAYKIAQTKTAMDEMGKSLTEEQREFINRINAERKTIVTELDELKEEIRRPVTEYEEREKARVAKHQSVLAHIDTFGEAISLCGAAELAERHATLKALDVSNLDEFSGPAETKKNGTLYLIAEAHKEACEKEAAKAKAEADRIERERIEREDREARIAAEAAQKARLEAEQKAAEEARRAEEAREAERKAEEARIAAIEAEKAAAELQAKEAAERAERERIEAEERHKREIAEAEARAHREAEEKEKARIAAIGAERIADEKRAANKRHREKILAEVAEDIGTLRVSGDIARELADAITAGKIRHVSIQF
jgi:colicin import membrane protein